MKQSSQSSTLLMIPAFFTDHNCNPGFLLGIGGSKDKSKVTFDSESIVGLVIWMCCVLYSSLRTASKSSKITMSEHVLVKDTGAGKYCQFCIYYVNKIEIMYGLNLKIARFLLFYPRFCFNFNIKINDELCNSYYSRP